MGFLGALLASSHMQSLESLGWATASHPEPAERLESDLAPQRNLTVIRRRDPVVGRSGMARGEYENVSTKYASVCNVV